MITYSIPVAQTTLTQFMVEVTTLNGEEYAYYLFMDPDEGDHPGTTAIKWLNQDELESESGDRSDGEYFVTEYGVFDNPNCPPEDINPYLQRYQGEGVQIVGDRIKVDHLEYAFIPGCFDHGDYDTIEEWADDHSLDLKVHRVKSTV